MTAVVERSNTSSARLALRLGFRPAGGTATRATFVLAEADRAAEAAAQPSRGAADTPPFGTKSVDNR